jgi:hypothetical protein
MHTNHNDHPQAEAPLTAGDLDAIAARHRDATPGPWGWTDIADSTAGWQGPDLTGLYLDPDRQIDKMREWRLSSERYSMGGAHQVVVIPEKAHTPLPRAGDATFIAHAWEDVRRLVANVRAQAAELARLRKAAAAVEGDPDSFDCHDGEEDGVVTSLRAHVYFLRHDLAALDEALDHWTLSDVEGAEMIVRLDRAGVAVRRTTDQHTAPEIRRSVRRNKRGART